MKKFIICALAAALGISSLAGCGKKQEAVQNVSDEPKGEISYPIDTDVTLKYWVRLTAALGTSVKNFGETPFAKKLMEDTGIKVEYMHPAQGQDNEVLNLLIASGDLPDIIETNWHARNPESVIQKKTIVALNDLIEDYSPNLKKYLSENEDVDKQIKTDAGQYYVYPFIRDDEKLLSTAGFMARKDWLDEAGIALPETMDEWDTMLEALSSKCDIPLAMSAGDLSYFCGAYDTSNTFFINNSGKIEFGAVSDGYRSWLEKMNEWYKKGYIDSNFAILDGTLKNSYMLGGQSIATFGAGGGQMGLYLNTNKDRSAYDLTAIPFPASKKGTRPAFGNKQFRYSPMNGAAITGKSANAAIAARFLDYSYSEAGYMLNNFGIEGESYEMKDGYPTYTEIITNNPDGLAMSQALPLYVRSVNEGPFVQDVRYIEQYYATDEQRDALGIWGANDHEKHAIPQITMTKEETDEYSEIMNEINTYRDEMTIGFIVGSEDLSTFPAYAEKIKSMGLDRATELQQDAYDRFLAR